MLLTLESKNYKKLINKKRKTEKTNVKKKRKKVRYKIVTC